MYRLEVLVPSDVQRAFDELRNAIWMLALPLVLGGFALFGVCQWTIQDLEWQERLEKSNPSMAELYEVAESECIQPRPEGDGVICAQTIEWWVEADLPDCEVEQCYVPVRLSEAIAVLYEMERYYLLVPGLIPLIFLFVVIRKIVKARRALNAALSAWSPP